MQRGTIATVVLAWLLAVTAAEAAAKRPSILVLLTDDQRYDALGVAGHPHLRTPHIDRLARAGVRFQNAFVTTSICCVSRASFLTGQYARHHRVGDFATPLAPDRLGATYPAILKTAGYRTGCLGKWGLGGDKPRAVFDVWHAWGGQGAFFDEIDGQRVHNSELLARRAIDFVRTTPPDQPFCLLVLYKAPHEPYLPDPADAELFRDTQFAIPRTYDAESFAALPDFIRASEGRIRLEAGHPTPERYQEFVRQYLRCVAGVDRSVGRIMAALEETGRDDDTIVVFSSDNGFLLGEHGLSGKWLMYEESIRVPLVIRDPRVPPERRGTTVDALALHIDVAPTLVDLAGLAPLGAMDGRSLRPLLEGQAVGWRDDFFYEHHYAHGGRIPRSEGVRTRDWKYVTYLDAEPRFEELYDLRADPLEERNLAAEPAARQRLESLRARYKEYLARLGER